MATATETLLETLRDVLERFGLTWLKSKNSSEDAINGKGFGPAAISTGRGTRVILRMPILKTDTML